MNRPAAAGLFISQRTGSHSTGISCTYHSRIVLSVGSSVWYVVWNRCTVTIDSVLANSKRQDAFLFPVHAMFHHDCLQVVKPASTRQHLGHKNTWRDSRRIDMLPFGVNIPTTVPQKSEILEGLMNYPVYRSLLSYVLSTPIKPSRRKLYKQGLGPKDIQF
jgi:hypothetical protein